MNFLAHIYLSGENIPLSIGNFIADAVKGTHYKNYPEQIKQGILLHRKIDTFTDKHPIVRQSKNRLSPIYGLYNGVIIDILYDHFLAANWQKYSVIDLEKYVQTFYKNLKSYEDLLPAKILKLMPIMIQQNWLLNYATIPGIEKILSQMNNRTKGKSKMHLAINDLKQNYTHLENDFYIFFEELTNYTYSLLLTK